MLHFMPPGKSKGTGDFPVLGSQIEEGEQGAAMVHLNRLSSELHEASIKSSSVVMVSISVAGCILNYPGDLFKRRQKVPGPGVRWCGSAIKAVAPIQT